MLLSRPEEGTTCIVFLKDKLEGEREKRELKIKYCLLEDSEQLWQCAGKVAVRRHKAQRQQALDNAENHSGHHRCKDQF